MQNICKESMAISVQGFWTIKNGNIVGSFGNIDARQLPCVGTSATYEDVMAQFVDHCVRENGLDIPDQTEFVQDVELVQGMMCREK
jgi:hypothetical protein